jgi:hypothetical protein
MEPPFERWFHSKTRKMEFQQGITKICVLYNIALAALGIVTKENAQPKP